MQRKRVVPPTEKCLGTIHLIAYILGLCKCLIVCTFLIMLQCSAAVQLILKLKITFFFVFCSMILIVLHAHKLQNRDKFFCIQRDRTRVSLVTRQRPYPLRCGVPYYFPGTSGIVCSIFGILSVESMIFQQLFKSFVGLYKLRLYMIVS